MATSYKWLHLCNFNLIFFWQSYTCKVSLLGVIALWGGCMFIPAGWGVIRSGGHISRFVLCSSIWRHFTIRMIKIVKVFVFSFWKLTHWFKYVYGTPKKWAQHFPYSNFTLSISLYFKPSFDEGPIFAIFCWKAVQGLKHIYVVKNRVQK